MKICPNCQSSYPDAYDHCPRDGKPLIEADAWSEGMVIRGKYKILGKLGQGGMGSVYKALHVRFEELRALKVMSPELASDSSFVKRFMREAVITRKLHHPNAVHVEDIDEAEDGRPFIVMEFIEGRSLRKVMEEERPLPIGRTCSIIRQAAAALDAAHQLGMVHRDIKPDNIVLIQTPQGEQAKVLDFGIAKLRETGTDERGAVTMTKTGMIVGTPPYMSPEQARGLRGDQLDGRSDLYSLGIVMYEMLAGQLPFRASTTMEMLMAHIQDPPAPILSAHPELPIPEGIAHLAMRLLEKKPEMRPATGAELIRELEQAQSAQTLRETRVVKPVAQPGSAPPAPVATVQRTPTPPPKAVPAVEVEAPPIPVVETPAHAAIAPTQAAQGTKLVAAIQMFYLLAIIVWQLASIVGSDFVGAALTAVDSDVYDFYVVVHTFGRMSFTVFPLIVFVAVPTLFLGRVALDLWRGNPKGFSTFNKWFYLFYAADIYAAILNVAILGGFLLLEGMSAVTAQGIAFMFLGGMVALPWFQRISVRNIVKDFPPDPDEVPSEIAVAGSRVRWLFAIQCFYVAAFVADAAFPLLFRSVEGLAHWMTFFLVLILPMGVLSYRAYSLLRGRPETLRTFKRWLPGYLLLNAWALYLLAEYYGYWYLSSSQRDYAFVLGVAIFSTLTWLQWRLIKKLLAP